MTPTLLKTKILPPITRSNLVARPNLTRQLNKGLDAYHRLTLVSAPAGFGKTTLVAEWLYQQERPQAWVTIDQGDNDLIRFWQYIIAALQIANPKLGKDIQPALQTAQPQIIQELLTLLVNDLAASPTRLILTLDDYHLIQSQAVHSSLQYFIDFLPPQIHLVIITRETTPFPTAHLKARGQMNEIRASELRFSDQEVSTFLNQTMELALTRDQINQLEEKTEGWIAALQLAALSLKETADKDIFINTFSGESENVMEYLIEEVLSHLPQNVQNFLLKTSILSRFTRHLCDAVIQEDTENILDYLRNENLFLIPLDHRNHWFRYYHLFAELLRARASSELFSILPTLHMRACNWFEHNGLFAEAIEHASQSGNADYTAQLFEKYIFTLIDRGEIAQARQYICKVPEASRYSRPLLCLLDALTMFAVQPPYPLDQIAKRIQDAEKAKALVRKKETKSESEQRHSDLVDNLHDTLCAMLGVYQGREPEEMIPYCQQILERIPEDQARLRAGVWFTLGLNYQALGDAEAAINAYEEAIQISYRTGELYTRVVALTNLCRISIKQGKLYEALLILKESLDRLERQYGQPPICGVLHLLIGNIYLEWNQIDNSLSALTKGNELIRLTGELDYQALGILYLIELRLAQDDLPAAHLALEELRKTEDQSGVSAYSSWMRARIWLRQGEKDARYLVAAEQLMLEQKALIRWEPKMTTGYLKSALMIEQQLTLALTLIVRCHQRLLSKADLVSSGVTPLIESINEFAQKKGWQRLAIQSNFLMALAQFCLGETLNAYSYLEEALKLAESAEFIRIFMPGGELAGKLLSGYLDNPVKAARFSQSFIDKLTVSIKKNTAATDQGKIAKPDLSPSALQTILQLDELSARELEVLKYISIGLSNKEIAEQLIVSISTVKGHTTNIFSKLGVSSRTQAVARARLLEILPPS